MPVNNSFYIMLITKLFMPLEQKNISTDKTFPIIILIIGIILFFGSSFIGSFLGIGYGIFGSLAGYIIGVILIVYSVILLIKSKNKIEDKKAYKDNFFPSDMKIQHIFYTIGVFFIFASVWYFAREFIADLPNSIKLLLLIVGIILAFVIAEFLRGADK